MKSILTILLFIGFSGHTYKTDLGLNLKEGETYSQYYVSSSKISQTIMGMEQEVNMEISGGVNYFVKKKNKDSYTMEVSYSRMVMKTKTMAGEVTFSSEGETDDLISSLLKALIGKKFDVEMQKNGVISKIENTDRLWGEMMSVMPEMPEAQKEQVLNQIKTAYGDKAFKGNIEMITAILPDQNVKEGGTWKNTVKLESGMSAFLDNTFILAEVNDDYIMVEGESRMYTEGKEAYQEINGMKATFDLSGKVISTYKLDPETNWVIEGSIDQEMSGEVDIADNPQLPGGITFPMSIKTEMKVTQ